MMDSAPTRATLIRPSFPKLLDCSEPHLVSPYDFSDYVQEGHDADEEAADDFDDLDCLDGVDDRGVVSTCKLRQGSTEGQTYVLSYVQT